MIIWGNTISTNTSRPDYAETNEAMASFIKNKPDAAIKKAQDTADLADAAAGKAQKAADDAQKTADSKVAQITAELVLPASGWSGERQTVTVEGVTTINTVFIAPVPSSIEPFGYYEITCVKQGNGNLTFSCEGEPDTDITLNVVILDVTVSPESGNPAVPGEDGGYYIPRVTQIDATTVRFEFTPSETDMPAVDPVTVTLPAGTGGGGSADLTGYATEAWVQAGYQPKGNYALASQIPSVPVQSVNGKTGAVKLNAADVGADSTGTASSAVSGHNVSTDAHNDIRIELQKINAKLTAFFNSDDQTLDELSEIVAYITSNKSLIDAITTSKVSVLDIVNDLVTNVPAKPLSAAQGVVLKGLIDALSTGKLDASKLQEAINTALAQAKASGEFDGQRGTGILNVTSSTISASGTGPTGIEIKYKIALSTVKDEAGVDEVLVGDTVKRSVYLYPVANVDASYVYLGAYTSIKGSNGTPVTVKSVAESSESGGSNVVTFSDNKTLTVKNGKDGRDPVRGTDYWTDADQEAIVQQVMQALATPVYGRVDDENNIIVTASLADGTYTLKYEYADGKLVTIGDVVIGVNYTNLVPTAEAYDSTEPYDGKGYKNGCYLSGSAPYEGSDGATVLTGYMPYAVPATGLPGTIYISGAEVQTISHCRIYFFDETKVMSGSGVQGTVLSTYYTIENLSNGVTKLTPIASGNTSKLIADSKAQSTAVYFRMSLVGTGENLIITVDEPIV